LLIAGSIIEAGCDAFADIQRALFVPIFSVLFMALAGWFWVFVAISVVAQDVNHTAYDFMSSVNTTAANETLLI